MLRPIMHLLKTKHIVLASSSPRRQEIIKNIGLDVELCPSLFEENLKPSDFPTFDAFVEETALQKVFEVAGRLSNNPPDIIIGADTIVTMDGAVFGKPKTKDRAFEMLSKLVGRDHVVYTGVVIKFKDKIIKFTEKAKVFVGKATAEQIMGYVDTGEPLDKAGGYGIQGVGGSLIERIEGDYLTVMGLPLYRISRELCELFDYKIK